MGRAPCCEKMGLKKGPWSPEEDQILINYINLHGHSNWRALPKQAGLLRCGKSCRLRWTNYLRPDIKRGNFTQEEENTIIKLHELLGNRWSAIAARLPGRTDNEIKNVWHTHLKKRLPKLNESETASATTGVVDNVVVPTKKRAGKSKATKKGAVSVEPRRKHVKRMDDTKVNTNKNTNDSNKEDDKDIARPPSSIIGDPVSPQPCTSEISTITSNSTSENDKCIEGNVREIKKEDYIDELPEINDDFWTITSNSTSENDKCSEGNVREIKKEDYMDEFPEINDDFWMEVLSVEDTAMSTEELPGVSQCYMGASPVMEPLCVLDSKVHSDDMDYFWYNLLTRSDDLPEISEML